MVTSVRFENFKSLREVAIDLEPFTVLVGANGSGKSSVLQGMMLLTAFFDSRRFRGHPRNQAEKIFRPPYSAERLAFAGAGTLSLTLTGSTLGGFTCRWTRSAEAGAGAGSPPGEFSLGHVGPAGATQHEYASKRVPDAFFDAIPPLGNGVLLQLDSNALAQPWYSDDPDPHIEYDGTGLAPTLQKLQVLRDGRFERIEEALRKVVPSILRLRAVPAPVVRRERQRISVDEQEFTNVVKRERSGSRIQADVRGSGWIDADLLSEGTLLTLALLTVIHDEQPSMLLLDDLDHGLHPLAQAKLIEELRAIQAASPGLQIVATTHSPFVVDCCKVEEVRVIRLLEDGSSQCQALAAHPRWEKRKGYLSPGEFWSGVGEEWVGGTP